MRMRITIDVDKPFSEWNVWCNRIEEEEAGEVE